MTVDRPSAVRQPIERHLTALSIAVAGAAWLGSVVGLMVTAGGALPLLVGTAASGVLAGTCLLLRRHGTGVLLVVVACSALVSAVRMAPLVVGEVPDAAARAAYVRAVVEITSDPAPRAGRVQGSARRDDEVLAAATLLRLEWAGRVWQGSVPIRIAWTAAPDSGRPAVVLGSTWSVRGRLTSAEPLSRSAGFLRADRLDLVESAGPVSAVLIAIRAGAHDSAARIGGDGAALVPGLTLGDTTLVPDTLAQAMRDTGLSHLTAVSGGNVAITLAMLWWVARRLRVRRTVRLLLGAAAIPAFVALVRPDPSVLRAAAMAGIVLAARSGGLRTRPVVVLAASVTVLLLLDPFLAVSLGFALSAAATGGLVMWARGRPPTVGNIVAAAVGASVAASLATAPLIVGIGGGLPVLSVPANLAAAAAVAPVAVLGLSSALVAAISPTAADLLCTLASIPAAWIAGIARRGADLPVAVLPWPSGWAGAVELAALIMLILTAFIVTRRSRQGRVVVAAGCACIVVVALGPAAGVPVPSAWPPPRWLAVACDVGQGDALVLRAGDGTAVVVDAGPDPRAVDGCLRRLHVDSVPVLVLTHDHADHVEGVPGVLRGRGVGSLVQSPLVEPRGEADRVARWARDAGISARVAWAGERGSVGDVSWQVLWPDRLLRGTNSDPNNASVVLLVAIRGVTFLLGGDVEPEAQRLLLRVAPPGHVDVVKVPHHGSPKQVGAYATSTAPRIALVSVGLDNDYGHPSPATLAAYLTVGAAIGRTDRDGDLAVTVGDDGGVALLARGHP